MQFDGACNLSLGASLKYREVEKMVKYLTDSTCHSMSCTSPCQIVWVSVWEQVASNGNCEIIAFYHKSYRHDSSLKSRCPRAMMLFFSFSMSSSNECNTSCNFILWWELRFKAVECFVFCLWNDRILSHHHVRVSVICKSGEIGMRIKKLLLLNLVLERKNLTRSHNRCYLTIICLVTRTRL